METAHDAPAADGLLSPDALKGRVAIVTGGGTGIGLAIAKRLGSLGATLVIGSRNAQHLEAGIGGAAGAPATTRSPVQVDVRKPDQVDEMVHRAVMHFGRVDILVNNAAGNFICRAEDLSPNGWNAVIGIVLNGSFYCSRAVGRHMIAARQGRRRSSRCSPTTSGPAAPAPFTPRRRRPACMSMTQTLAVEWAPHRIRVNAVAPGPIESPGAAKQLWPSPEASSASPAACRSAMGAGAEVADAVAFLVSDRRPDSSPGETLTIDGGAVAGAGNLRVSCEVPELQYADLAGLGASINRILICLRPPTEWISWI